MYSIDNNDHPNNPFSAPASSSTRGCRVFDWVSRLAHFLFTSEGVGVEGQGAGLDVEWKSVDAELTGAHHSHRLPVHHQAVGIQVTVRHLRDHVLLHAEVTNDPDQWFRLQVRRFCSLPPGTYNSLMTMSGTQSSFFETEIRDVPHCSGSQLANSFFHSWVVSQ